MRWLHGSHVLGLSVVQVLLWSLVCSALDPLLRNGPLQGLCNFFLNVSNFSTLNNRVTFLADLGTVSGNVLTVEGRAGLTHNGWAGGAFSLTSPDPAHVGVRALGGDCPSGWSLVFGGVDST